MANGRLKGHPIARPMSGLRMCSPSVKMAVLSAYLITCRRSEILMQL